MVRIAGVDLVSACRAFVAVSERGSFSLGAARLDIPQPAASRRVAALESALGGQVFDRSSRRAALTPLGRDLLPFARRVVDAADRLLTEASRAERRPVTLALPRDLPISRLVGLGGDAKEHDIPLAVEQGPPEWRRRALAEHSVDLAVLVAPAAEADWSASLGFGSAAPDAPARTTLAELRPRRSAPEGRERHLWLRAEDDVPHIHDAVLRDATAAGLRPSQIRVGELMAALSAVVTGADLLLCSRAEAAEWGLSWSEPRDIRIARGYRVQSARPADAARLMALTPSILATLGTPVAGAGR